MAARIGMIALWILLLLAVLVVGRLVTLSVLAKAPQTLGARDGALAPCPRTPNCVSSQAKGRSHSIRPLVVDGGESLAVATAERAIAAMPRAQIVTVEDGYLHAEFRSLVFRFVDDLELLYDAELPGFQVRSASRVGNSDLGVNRKRVEALRAALSESG